MQWSSGITLACCARGPRFESRCGQNFVFSRRSLRYAALGTGCTLTAVHRSTQPSTHRGTVNACQPYAGVIIQMAMGECSVYSSLQVDSKVKSATLAYELAATWRWPTSAQMTQSELSYMAGAVDDSTINIVVVIIIVVVIFRPTDNPWDAQCRFAFALQSM